MAAEGKIHSRMATADANVLAGATNGANNGQDTESKDQESAEPEGNRGEELDGKIKEGDGEERVAIERTQDEL